MTTPEEVAQAAPDPLPAPVPPPDETESAVEPVRPRRRPLLCGTVIA